MLTFLLTVYVIVCLLMILLIIMQQGKGAEAGASFGSGASGTVFGASGSGNFLTRTTGVLATLFFLLSLGLAFLSNRAATHPPVPAVASDPVSAPVAPPASVPAPAAPVAPPPAP